MTQAFLPLLGADPDREGKPGRIVMISSVGGERGMPFMGPYNASKFALEGYSQALRRELLLFGVDVIVIGPGAIATPIWDKVDDEAVSRYANSPYAPALTKMRDFMLAQGKTGLPASTVADLVWRCLAMARPKTRYPILRRPFMDRTMPGLLGPRAVDRVVARRLGFPHR